MTTSYPFVTDAELRAQYQKTDQIQSQRVLKILMWLSLPLLYMDFSILGLGQSFVVVAIVRLLASDMLGGFYEVSNARCLWLYKKSISFIGLAWP